MRYGIAATLIWSGWTYIAQPTVLVGYSMSPTLQSGDRVVVFKWLDVRVGPWGRSLRRYDIVQCRKPGRRDELVIKRLIGLPGERVRIADGEVFVNDVRLEEPYRRRDDERPQSSWRTFPDITRNVLAPSAFQMFDTAVRNGHLMIPMDYYFVLGDNRSSSQDSRLFGLIYKDDVLGIVPYVLWSFDSDACRAAPNAGGCFFQALRTDRVGMRAMTN